MGINNLQFYPMKNLSKFKDLEDLQDLRNAKKEEENSPSIPLSEVKKNA